MAYAISWDADGKKYWETGASHGVLYVKDKTDSATNKLTYSAGVPWNGLTGFTESPSGAEETELYANDKKYGSMRSAEKFGGTIEAYTYPDEFEKCDGSDDLGVTGVAIGQQTRYVFAFTYQTVVGNDESNNAGIKLHVVYGCTVSPSEKAYASINDSPEAITFSWEVSSTPVTFDYTKSGETTSSEYSTSTLTIDTTKLVNGAKNAKFLKVLDSLYGTAKSGDVEEVAPKLLMPDEILEMLEEAA